MKKLVILKKDDGTVSLSGNGTFEIKAKIKKYGFAFDFDQKAWIGDVDKLETLEKYIKKFKNGRFEIHSIVENS